MDSESTVNRLIKDIDNEVDIEVASRIESETGVEVGEKEEPLDLPESHSGSSLDSVKHVNLTNTFENISDTSTDTEQHNNTQLDAPVKMFPKIAADVVTPDLTTLATEVMSGPTLASRSNQVYMNRSPTASTERLKAMLENEQAEEELELDNDMDMDKEPTAPKRFSLELTKPLLPYQNRENDDSNIMRVETASDADCLDNSFTLSPATYNQQSPRVIQSPSRIPLTNTVRINQFAMNPAPSGENTPLSPTVVHNRRVHSVTGSSVDVTIPVPPVNPPSIPPTPEMHPLVFTDDFDVPGEHFSQKYNTRIFSLATSLGNGSNIKSQNELDVAPEGISNTESESDMIDTLNLSDGSESKELLTADDPVFNQNDTELLHEDLDALENSSSSTNGEDSEPEIFVNIDKQTEYTNQKIIEAKSEIEEFMITEVSQSSVAIPKESQSDDASTDCSHSPSIDNNTFEPDGIASLNESSSDTSVSDGKTSMLQNNDESSILTANISGVMHDHECSSPNMTVGKPSTMVSTSLQTPTLSKHDSAQENKENSIDTCEKSSGYQFNEGIAVKNDVSFELPQVVDERGIVSQPMNETLEDATTSSLPDNEENFENDVVNETLPEIVGFEPLHMESPFDADGDNSFGSSTSEDNISPKNYLSVWHTQQSIPSFTPRSKKIVQKSNVPEAVSERISSFSFKPTLIHGSKIHYSDSNRKISNDRKSVENDSMTTSLSEDFEFLLNKMASDDQSLNEPCTPSSGHLNIWKTDDETPNFNREEVIEKLAQRALAVEQIISHDPAMIVKSQIDSAIVGKADSIRSFEIDSDGNSISEGYKIHQSRASTPSNLIPQLSNTDYAAKSPVSPFKILTSRNNSPRKASYKSPLFDNITNTRVAKKLEASVPVVDDKDNQEDAESYMTIAMVKDLKNPNVVDEFIDNNEKDGEITDKGLLYIHLDKVRVDLSDISRHKAQFSLEIDNGINVTTTSWTSLTEDKYLVIDKELEIPVRELDESLRLTLKCKYERPEYELYEVMEKVRTGKKYKGLGKTSYKYEKRYKQKPLKQDPWDYLFGPDGSFGSTQLLMDANFLDQTQFREVKNVLLPLVNKWSQLAPTSNQSSQSPIKRKPYTAGEIIISTCYLKRSSELERFPKSLHLVHEMTNRFKIQKDIRKEGALLQEGGDVRGMIKKRFFRLAGNSLIGFHEISGKPKISINLLKAVDVIDNNDFQGKSANNRDFTNLILFGESFNVIFDDGESISFYSDTSPQETRDWFNAIKQSVALNAVYQPWVKQMVELET